MLARARVVTMMAALAADNPATKAAALMAVERAVNPRARPL